MGPKSAAIGQRGRKKRDLVKESIRNRDEFQAAASDSAGFYGTGYKASLAWMVRLDTDIDQAIAEINESQEDWIHVRPSVRAEPPFDHTAPIIDVSRPCDIIPLPVL